MKNCLIGFIVAFLICVIVLPILIRLIVKMKAGQTILNYVELHKAKDGTPTMGGISFIISTVVVGMFMLKENSRLATILLLCFVFFGLIGFLDDFLKVWFKHNLGLTPIQKIIAQVAIAIAISIYVYSTDLVGSSILLPFINAPLNLGIFIIPFTIVVILGTVNSVNLIDGLDGLCGGVSMVVLVVLMLIGIMGMGSGSDVYIGELQNLNLMLGILAGGILAFLVFNSKPAKIFMGDTGSLAIGGMIAGFIVLSRQSLLILIVGVMYIITALSVILQVVVYKVTKKRIFKIAPIHHQFEMMYGESKVVAVYVILSMVVGVVTLIGYM